MQAFRVNREIGNITINYKLRNGLFSKFEPYEHQLQKKHVNVSRGVILVVRLGGGGVERVREKTFSDIPFFTYLPKFVQFSVIFS